MQRVSAFLPSWDKRNSNSSGSAASKPSGLFGWAGRNNNGNNNVNNNGGCSNSSSSNQNSNRNSNTSALNKSLARINVGAANGDRVQREAFWPSTLDMECVKAARILKSFCTDGYLAPVEGEPQIPAPASSSTSDSKSEPQTPIKVMKKIPKRIIQNAAGIAVFTCMRSGLWMTGSGGSGILIARKSDGTWSTPSGIMLHTPTLSFIIGVDVYDCVLVVTNLSALESITRARVTLGEDVTLRNGPSVTLDSDDVNFNWKTLDNTVLAYMKARGQHQAVNLQGCILTERGNENERFYGADVTQMDILAGNVARHVEETKPLFEVIKLAEGRTDYDKDVVELTAVQPAPGDAVIATPQSSSASPRPSFGIPKVDDPDPFGVLALEMAGLEIREAGTHPRPASSQFEITASPRSPTLAQLDRQSIDTSVSKSNRASVRSSNTIKSQVTDAGTQTDIGIGNTPETTPSPGQSDDSRDRPSVDRIPEVKEAEEVDYTAVDLTPLRHLSPQHSVDLLRPEQPAIPPRNRPKSGTASLTGHKTDPVAKAPADETEDGLEYDTNDADDEDDHDDSDEEPVVFEVAQVQPTQTKAIASRMIQAKGSVVTIPKRVPPPLPTRSPARNSRSAKSDMGVDNILALSPLRQAFSEADLRSEEEMTQKRQTDKNLAEIETSKPADLGQSLIQGGNNSTAEDANLQSVRTDESAQMTPSIDTALLLDGARHEKVELCEEVSTEQSGKNQALPQETPFKQSQSLRAEVTSAAQIPLPEEPDSQYSDIHGTDSEYGSVEEKETEDDDCFKTPQEPIDNSDSTTSKKHTSSVYTGLTEDRWSIDRSSLTTPTSDRPVSVAEYTTEEDTPKKMSRDEELGTEKQQDKMAVNKPLETRAEGSIASA
ncbi:hypothetical protein QQS21_010515 [Conoideocrella luteorostrata]|uniref:Ysc84 actin-binding domain-containing protein n=1 Tax=Conoideocrella luteorostrata TaxID=1105319 RepID=A0AAJ0CHK8_9HYPO|nr:hypothetical protein QQS21_010515 [Conoideocrella luteorostrata]